MIKCYESIVPYCYLCLLYEVLKMRKHKVFTRFRNCAAQFRNWVAILKSGDNFEIGTQIPNFQIAQRDLEIAQIYKTRGTDILRARQSGRPEQRERDHQYAPYY